MIRDISTMIRQRIHSTGMNPAMAQPQHDHGSCDEDILAYILAKHTQQPANSVNHLGSCVAVTEASR